MNAKYLFFKLVIYLFVAIIILALIVDVVKNI